MRLWSDEPITFDQRDTLHSARGKLEAGGRGRPVVVLDPKCRIAENVLAYRLLARMSQQLGTPVAVITGNPSWRRLAREHGLRAFSSLGALRRSRRQTPASYAEAAADFLLSSVTVSFSRQGWAILAIVGIATIAALYTFLPVMKVSIQVPVEEIRQEMVVRADASISTMDVSSGVMPARVLEHRFTVSDTVSTAGEKTIGKDKAKGEVTVINSSASLVTIPAGSVLTTSDGQKFTTITAVAVGAFLTAPGTPTPAPGTTPGAAGTTVKVPVVALEAGQKGNVPALAISRFESESLRSLTVFNERPLTGGTDAKGKVASAEDRSRLKEALFQRAQSQGLSELQVRVRQSESLVPHSMQVRIEREDYDKELDEEADRLRGTLSVVASAIAFANADLNTLVEKQWKNSVPQGFRAAAATLRIDPPEVTQAGSQTASLRVRATGRAERVVEADDLSLALRGLTAQEARSKLAKMENLRLVKLEMWPDWATRAQRVEVQTAQ